MNNSKRPLNETSPESPPISKRYQLTMAELPDEIGKMNPKKFLDEISSLIDSKLLATKDDVAENGKKFEKLEAEIHQLKENEKELRNEIEMLQNFNKRCNLIIRGIPFQTTENCKEVVIEFCKTILKLNDLNLTKAFRVGEEKKSIFVTFQNDYDVQQVLREGPKLKNTPYTIQRDYTYKTRSRRNKLFLLRKYIKTQKPDMKTFVRDDYIYVADTKFWLSETGIQLQNKSDGMIVLNNIIQVDATDFVQNLLKEKKGDETLENK